MESPDTLRDAIIWFADFEHCRQFMTTLRWPDGVVKCPQCGAEKLTWLAKQRVWKCYAGHERPTFSLKTGTIFEDSPIALEKWLPGVWMLLNCKNGISSYEIHRGLGVTQKTAWFMLHRIRLASQNKDVQQAWPVKWRSMKPSLEVRRAICTPTKEQRRSTDAGRTVRPS